MENTYHLTGEERLDADRIYFNRVRPRLIEILERPKIPSQPRKNQDRCNRLYDYANKHKINPDNKFSDTDHKRFACAPAGIPRWTSGIPSNR